MKHQQFQATRQPKVRQRGATMIELLVSILLFAFGMLGMVGLQTRTLSYGQASLFRSQATALTDDVFDRMRADRVAAKGGQWSTTTAVLAPAITGTSNAKVDLKDWKQQVEALLPTGRAAIAVAGDVVTVTVEWDERGETRSFETISGL